MVTVAFPFKIKVLLATYCLMFVHVINGDFQFSFFSKDDTYQRYQCMASSTGSQSPIGCSMLCFRQFGCIGIFHDGMTSECLLINRTEKIENCSYTNSKTWRAYKKRRGYNDIITLSEIGIGTCNIYLMNTFGYMELRAGDETDKKGLLNYVPSSSEEIGGIFVNNTAEFYVYVILPQEWKIIGIATQGRWRNDSFESCCDERVTSYEVMYWNVDKWAHYMNLEANIIADAGNEVVFNFFPTPIISKYFYIHIESYHLKPVIRLDFVGCEA